MTSLDSERRSRPESVSDEQRPQRRDISGARRLEALRASALLDATPEACFDNLTRMAAQMVNTPAAFLSVVDGGSLFFKSIFGFVESLQSTRRLNGETFCRHALLGEKVLAVADARQDPRFRDLFSVTRLGIVAYLGVPLVTASGCGVGAFCVVDFKPRIWSGADVSNVLICARAALREIESRLRFTPAQSAESVRGEVPGLSQRESDVLRRIVAGQHAKQIALELDVSAKTIATYRNRLMRKLNLRDNHDLFRFAVQHGLVNWE